MESINTFVGGMNKDASNLIQNKNTYKDALNFGVGRNQGALVNYKGNELSLTIPNTSSVIEAVYNGGNFPITGTSGFTINGVSKSVLRNGLTLKGFLEKLADEFNTDTVLQNLGIKVWVNNQNTGLIFTAVNQFVNITYSAIADFQFTVKIPVQTDLEVIGWTTIRDTIILLTTNHDTNDFNGIGQIWKLEYNDKSDAVTNLELLYNNVCGFTKYHPMRRVIGRYEIPETQNIYFTDFHNKLRKFNTADPNGFLVDIDNLSVSSAVNLDTPILTDILQSGGSHKTGIVQYAYFLRTTGGQETVFSDLSHIIYINEGNDELDNWVSQIKGSTGVTTTKQIKGIINYPDDDYNRIEVYRIYRDTITSNPIITKIKDDSTPSLGPYTFTDTGSENLGTISLDELLDLKYSFTHCKEIITKANILFALNVRSDMDDLPEYDARAFRYKLDSGNYVMDINNISGANEFSITNLVPSNNQIDPEADCIIPNDDEYIYNHVGVVGGVGPNISFTFLNYPALDDGIVNFPITDYTAQSTVAPGYRNKRRTNNTYTLDSSNRAYVNKNSFEANGPYTSGVLRGFQRGETYRFGIQFFNKEGKPYFVKWICDIKMPTDLKICDITPGSPVDNSNIYNLGVTFQVNTSLINDKISGYSIVRVKRTESDKTVLFSGLMNHMFREFSNATLHRSEYLNGTPARISSIEDSPEPLRTSTISDDHFVLVSPEIVINKSFSYQTGDRIYLNGIIKRDHTTYYDSPQVNIADVVTFNKFYDNSTNLNLTFDSGNKSAAITDCKISQAHFPNTDVLTQGVQLSNLSWCYNTHVPTDGTATTPNQVRFAGNSCLFLVLNNDSLTYQGSFLDSHYYVHYYRPNNNQYGGKGYENRSQNEYIACSRLVPVKASNLPVATSVVCFGGDTFVSVFDHFALFKGWGNGIDVTGPNENVKSGAVWYFPCESSYNFDIRWYDFTRVFQGGVGTGIHMNRNGYNFTMESNNEYIAFFGDDFVYYDIFSVENDIVKYLPKPLEFINQQEYDCRIYASNEKINGELTDSWTIWKTNRFYDLESVYGPINGAVVVRDNALVFQDRAFSQILINPTALIQGTTELILGTGSTIQTHKYISNDTGTKHQFSLVQTDDSVYWLDILKRKFYRFNGQNQSVSDIKGLHSFFQDILKGNIRLEDNPIHQDFSGITGTHNRIRNEVLYTFKDLDGKQYNEYPSVETEIVNLNNKIQVNNKFTISYDESLDAFISFLSFKPTIYINDGKRIITPNPTIPNELYIHGKDNYCEYYGTIYDSTVDIIANDKPIYTKTFDNFELLTEVLDTNNNQLEETFNTVICNTDYQQSNLITLTPNNTIKRKERTWQLFIPRSSTLDRLRDKYIKARFTYNNNNNKKLIFHLLTTIFRISSR